MRTVTKVNARRATQRAFAVSLAFMLGCSANSPNDEPNAPEEEAPSEVQGDAGPSDAGNTSEQEDASTGDARVSPTQDASKDTGAPKSDAGMDARADAATDARVNDAGLRPIDGPDMLNAAFHVTLGRKWLLRGDGLSQSDSTLSVRVEAPAGTTTIRGAVGAAAPVLAKQQSDGAFTLDFPVLALAQGEHTIKLAVGTSQSAFAKETFYISSPLYIVVSTDWDDTRFADDKLDNMEQLRKDHPKLVLSHFFAPYHYTDPLVPAARKVELENWVKAQRDTYGDELGVHIHCWCHFVTAANVKCDNRQTFYPSSTEANSGYVTILASYREADMRKLLAHSVKVFGEHNLGRPTSFRAGGWTADLSTLRALEAEGFTVDSSALPARRIEEWNGEVLYSWNMDHWNGITEKSQPYFPSTTKQVSDSPPPQLGILEVPDNGILVDYVSGSEMIDIYEMNAPSGKPLATPKVFQVGYHPPNFSLTYLDRMDIALSHVDENLYSSDSGPAVYVTISELSKVWHR